MLDAEPKSKSDQLFSAIERDISRWNAGNPRFQISHERDAIATRLTGQTIEDLDGFMEQLYRKFPGGMDTWIEENTGFLSPKSEWSLTIKAALKARTKARAAARQLERNRNKGV